MAVHHGPSVRDKREINMKFVERAPGQLPLALLLESDPAEQRIAPLLSSLQISVPEKSTHR